MLSRVWRQQAGTREHLLSQPDRNLVGDPYLVAGIQNANRFDMSITDGPGDGQELFGRTLAALHEGNLNQDHVPSNSNENEHLFGRQPPRTNSGDNY